MAEISKIRVQKFRAPKSKPLWTFVEVHYDEGSVYLMRVERRPKDRYLWVPQHPFGKVSVKSALWRRIVRMLNNAYEAYRRGLDFSPEAVAKQTWLDELDGSSSWRQRELF